MSGAIPLMTYKFNPTGGEIRPISILIVRITANQYGSNPADTTIGSRIGAAIRITATGGRKKPAISRKMLMHSISSQGLTSSVPIHCAMDWVMKRLDSM